VPGTRSSSPATTPGSRRSCVALDLGPGPERLARRPVIDEHDFFCGNYVDDAGKPIEIRITAVLTDMSEEARNRFYRPVLARCCDDGLNQFSECIESTGAMDR
jgi:putative ATP-dependent endonuclease of the OLD family